MADEHRNLCLNALCRYVGTSTKEFSDGRCPLCGDEVPSLPERELLVGALENAQSTVTPDKVKELLAKEEAFNRKFAGPLGKVWDYVQAFWALLKDPKAAWPAKVIAAAALVYVFSPVDLIPDFIPFIGFADDIAIVVLAVGALAGALHAYMPPPSPADSLRPSKPVGVYVLAQEHTGRSGECHEVDRWVIRLLSQQRVAELGLTSSNGVVCAGSLYALHPHIRNNLVLVSEYEATLAEQKWREYQRVLPILGCAELVLEKAIHSATSRKGRADVSYPPIFDGKISIEGGKAEVNQSKATDRFPDQYAINEDAIRRLYRDAVWALVDHQLADIIERRIEHGLDECHRDVLTTVDSRMNAEVVAKIKKLLGKIGLGVSAEYRAIGVTSVTLKVKFHPSRLSEQERSNLAVVRTRESAARLAELMTGSNPVGCSPALPRRGSIDES